jgi:hypothetical protein
MLCIRQPGAIARTHGVERRTARIQTRALKDNVAKLPGVDAIARVEIPALGRTLENVQGKKASLAIYNHLAEKYGKLNKDAAMEGLALFDEYVAEAKAHKGSHPNIDLLLEVVEDDKSLDLIVVKS